MKTVLNISCTLIIIFVYGIPCLVTGISRLKDKYEDRTTAILAICIGVMFTTLPLFAEVFMRWEI